jgi:DNA anti-recombination protein RmuC
MSQDNDGKRGGTAEAKAKAAPLPDQGPGNVDKIRDILFGNQMRDYETRFARLEESLRKESADLRETTRKRVDALESFIKRELESLESRLKTEKDERTDSHRDLTADLKSTAAAISKKISDTEDQNDKSHRDLRKDLLQQSKDLGDEIRMKTEELASLLDRRVQELRTDKTDRAALASLFTEVALRLNDEFHMPSAE